VTAQSSATFTFIGTDDVTPPELVRAILRAPVDLLFAGGIGTFVKASSESHAAVGDRANDQVRIDASELGARVVGEGANLALTQRARIQYARRGGRCNTDAIDNCAGVNTSDREVNLKILLRIAEERGALADRAERNALLETMADDVAAAVLRDSYLQTWAITQEVQASPGGLDGYEQLMTDLETAGGEQADRTKMVAGRLDRAVELLPSTREVHERKEAGAGLTRPELCVLIGYAKVDLRSRLLTSELPDQPYFARLLDAYFPSEAVARFGHLLARHRLRRELVATVVANSLINRMGITYVSRSAHEFGCMAWEVAAAHWIAREVLGAGDHWLAVEALDNWVDAGLQLVLKGEVDRVVNACTRAYLRHGVNDVDEAISRDGPAFAELEKRAAELGSPARRRARAERVRAYTDLGIDEGLAERLVDLGELVIVPDVASVARHADAPVRHVADVFLHLNDALPLDYLFEQVVAFEPADNWERWQQQGLLDDLRETRRDAALQVLREFGGEPAGPAVTEFMAARAEGAGRLKTVLGHFEQEQDDTLPALAVTARAVRKLLSVSA
jgi:glutamate dehydrogenase